ncbi:MAG: DEAD/DEAH box helicase family protein [Nitrospirae bacterium]|nr:DEAD/DEAH box helicase family protein [Nitrospirota bacterium]
MFYSAIRDNHSNGTVGDFLKQEISANSDVSVVSASFTIHAYYQLKNNLDSINKLRFLFGEPTFIKSMDPDKVNTKDFKIEDDKIAIPLERRLTQKTIAKECSEWIKEKTEIRSMVKPNFLHGKLYHVKQATGIEKAIAGSSNFTVNGLGLGGSKNIELNLVIDSDRDRQELREWFDKIWNDRTGLVEDVKDQVLKYLEQLYIENEPEFIYFKTLYHLFEHYLDEQTRSGLLDERTGFYDSEIWHILYDFQKDGVRGAINKILKHNGCIIADSVGLGKTFEALAVIKYFELLNARVLVVCPKKLTGKWTIYQDSQNHFLNPFKKDRYNYAVLYHTDMGREAGSSAANGIDLENFNWGAYDLVVIDESHNFRGDPIERVKDDGRLKMNRAKWLMEKVIKSGVKTKVLMLSATPVNNTLRDLRNQIAFITEGKDDALFEVCKIKDIGLTLKNAQTHFTNWADSKKNPKRNMKQLLERLDSTFFKLLDELTIARSRSISLMKSRLLC